MTPEEYKLVEAKAVKLHVIGYYGDASNTPSQLAEKVLLKILKAEQVAEELRLAKMSKFVSVAPLDEQAKNGVLLSREKMLAHIQAKEADWAAGDVEYLRLAEVNKLAMDLAPPGSSPLLEKACELATARAAKVWEEQ